MKEIRVLQPEHAPEIVALENQALQQEISDEMEREMAKWHVSWRQESLDHYLPLGWSFGIWQQGQLSGYFLAQPQLFTCGLTQTLWVERIMSMDASIASELIEVVFKICKDKHLQRALFHSAEKNSTSFLQLKQSSDILYELKTLKY